MVSGLYVANWRDALGAAQLTLNLDSATQMYVALFKSTLAPNYTTDAAYNVAGYTTNEASGTGYTAGGIVLSNSSITASSGNLVLASTYNPSWATATITARSIAAYAQALAGKNLVFNTEFGQDYTSTAGTFQVTWNASGIAIVDLTP